jgi:hypothetical protein
MVMDLLNEILFLIARKKGRKRSRVPGFGNYCRVGRYNVFHRKFGSKPT